MHLECDAILFDLDGVLLDSSLCVERSWHEWANEHGLDPAAIIRVAHGQRTIDTMRHFAPHLDVEEQAGRFAEREATDMEGVYPIPGASALVERLPQGTWAVVTSGGTTLALARLRHVGLPIPRALVTADDVKQGKPSPDPYLLAAARMELAPSACVVVEDSPPGIESARASGMRVIALTTTHKGVDLAGSDAIVDRLDSLRVTVREQVGPRIVIEIA
jgi:sugar-phosphatase